MPYVSLGGKIYDTDTKKSVYTVYDTTFTIENDIIYMASQNSIIVHNLYTDKEIAVVEFPYSLNGRLKISGFFVVDPDSCDAYSFEPTTYTFKRVFRGALIRLYTDGRLACAHEDGGIITFLNMEGAISTFRVAADLLMNRMFEEYLLGFYGDKLYVYNIRSGKLLYHLDASASVSRCMHCYNNMCVWEDADQSACFFNLDTGEIEYQYDAFADLIILKFYQDTLYYRKGRSEILEKKFEQLSVPPPK